MFKISKKKSSVIFRQGMIKTKNGVIKTPFFMPDATRGFIKSTTNEELEKINIGPMVVNTFHLLLQPTINRIKKVGGVHKFMSWNRPLLSDSGGFQVFSLVHRNSTMGKILEDRVIFRSPLDGSKHELTPELAINIQFDLGVDMMVCLDDCPPNNVSEEKLKISVGRTIFWAKKCKAEYEKQLKKRKIKDKDRPLLFSVIQGGANLKLREYCAKELIKIGFDGYGFGAMPVDENGRFLDKVLEFTAKLIPKDSLRFALGVGTPEDIVKCVFLGWDMFDCVIPTREGRHGRLFLWDNDSKIKKIISSKKLPNLSKVGKFYKAINITNSKFADDFSPINKDSKLPELRRYTKGYLHHLFKLKDPLGQKLASLNNLEFYVDLMEKLRRN